jgi:hypothetical protein
MQAEGRKQIEKPNPAECPRHFCFLWIERGSRVAEGLYNSIDEALNHVAFVQDDQCGCSFGVCSRLDPINGSNDWYEPNEMKLEKAGLPWFYFIPGPENLVDEERDKYVQESERLWGIKHWEQVTETDGLWRKS